MKLIKCYYRLDGRIVVFMFFCLKGKKGMNIFRTYAKINLVCFKAIVIASSKIECLI